MGAVPWTWSELTDMHLCLGLARGDAAEAKRLYLESHPDRDEPEQGVFTTVDQTLRATGRLLPEDKHTPTLTMVKQGLSCAQDGSPDLPPGPVPGSLDREPLSSRMAPERSDGDTHRAGSGSGSGEAVPLLKKTTVTACTLPELGTQPEEEPIRSGQEQDSEREGEDGTGEDGSRSGAQEPSPSPEEAATEKDEEEEEVQIIKEEEDSVDQFRNPYSDWRRDAAPGSSGDPRDADPLALPSAGLPPGLQEAVKQAKAKAGRGKQIIVLVQQIGPGGPGGVRPVQGRGSSKWRPLAPKLSDQSSTAGSAGSAAGSLYSYPMEMPVATQLDESPSSSVSTALPRSFQRDRSFVCQQCGRAFLQRAQLWRHMITHSEDGRPYVCEECGEKFKTDAGLKIHMERHEAERSYLESISGLKFRPLAPKIFVRGPGPESDMLRIPGPEEIGALHSDDQSSSSGSELPKRPKEERPFNCGHCARTFTSKPLLRQHMTVHSEEGKRHTCEKCGKNFRRKAGLELHMRKHTGVKPYACDQCDKTFSLRPNLVRHLRVHTGERPHVCEHCGKAFSQKTHLDNHKRSHASPEEQRAFDEHRHRSAGAPCICDKCGKVFSQKHRLDIHMRIHTGEKPYVCQECGKPFRQKGALDAHKRVHTGEKPYLCNVCGKAFRFKNDLVEHGLIHTGVKPFFCEVCGLSFPKASRLKRHKMIHTDEKPFECEVCGRAFRQKSHLKYHRRVHLPDHAPKM